MYQCKITVLEASTQEKLAQALGTAPVAPCPVFSPGQTWVLSHYGRPLDFCEDAWTAIHRIVYAVLSGAGSAIGGNWIEDGTHALACCNDGLRPVFFELTRLDG